MPGFPSDPTPGRNYRSAGGLTTSYEQVTTAEGETKQISLDAGDNPPEGVLILYHLPTEPKEGEPLTLTIRNAEGAEIRTFTSDKPDDQHYKDNPGLTKPTPLPAKAGANRFVWDLRYPNATEVPDDTGSMGFARGRTGPKAPRPVQRRAARQRPHPHPARHPPRPAHRLHP